MVDEAVATMSQTIKNMVEEDCAYTAIPLPNVDGKILAKVIHYCTKHVEMEKTTLADVNGKLAAPDVKGWDAEFMKGADMDTLYDLLLVSSSDPGVCVDVLSCLRCSIQCSLVCLTL